MSHPAKAQRAGGLGAPILANQFGSGISAPLIANSLSGGSNGMLSALAMSNALGNGSTLSSSLLISSALGGGSYGSYSTYSSLLLSSALGGGSYSRSYLASKVHGSLGGGAKTFGFSYGTYSGSVHATDVNEEDVAESEDFDLDVRASDAAGSDRST